MYISYILYRQYTFLHISDIYNTKLGTESTWKGGTAVTVASGCRMTSSVDVESVVVDDAPTRSSESESPHTGSLFVRKTAIHGYSCRRVIMTEASPLTVLTSLNRSYH